MNQSIRNSLLILSLLFINSIIYSQDIKVLTEDCEVALSDGFNEKSLNDYQFTDQSHWLITKNGESGKDLKCVFDFNDVPNEYFPSEVAFLTNRLYGDFIMEFDYLQKNREFTIRDICVLFGYQDSTHYYFAQAASKDGKYNHNIFKVENDRPVKIGESKNRGVIWNYQKWSHIVVVRKIEVPLLELYIDGELILSSSSDNGSEGKLGFGTYGSGFKIDNLKVWVPKELKEKKE